MQNTSWRLLLSHHETLIFWCIISISQLPQVPLKLSFAICYKCHQTVWSNFIEIAHRHGCSPVTSHPKNTFEGLLLLLPLHSHFILITVFYVTCDIFFNICLKDSIQDLSLISQGTLNLTWTKYGYFAKINCEESFLNRCLTFANYFSTLRF